MKKVVGLVGVGLILVLLVLAGRPGTAPAGAPKGKDADAKAQVEELRAELKRLEGLLPDQAAVMTHVGYHWANLWFALDRENWPLAEFYLSETRNNLKWAVRARPTRKTAAGVIDLGAIAQALDNAQLTQMKDALARKDRALGVKLYAQALGGCYACHKASEKPYLRLHRPKAPEVPIIDFDPGKGP